MICNAITVISPPVRLNDSCSCVSEVGASSTSGFSSDRSSSSSSSSDRSSSSSSSSSSGRSSSSSSDDSSSSTSSNVKSSLRSQSSPGFSGFPSLFLSSLASSTQGKSTASGSTGSSTFPVGTSSEIPPAGRSGFPFPSSPFKFGSDTVSGPSMPSIDSVTSLSIPSSVGSESDPGTWAVYFQYEVISDAEEITVEDQETGFKQNEMFGSPADIRTELVKDSQFSDNIVDRKVKLTLRAQYLAGGEFDELAYIPGDYASSEEWFPPDYILINEEYTPDTQDLDFVSSVPEWIWEALYSPDYKDIPFDASKHKDAQVVQRVRYDVGDQSAVNMVIGQGLMWEPIPEDAVIGNTVGGIDHCYEFNVSLRNQAISAANVNDSPTICDNDVIFGGVHRNWNPPSVKFKFEDDVYAGVSLVNDYKLVYVPEVSGALIEQVGERFIEGSRSEIVPDGLMERMSDYYNFTPWKYNAREVPGGLDFEEELVEGEEGEEEEEVEFDPLEVKGIPKNNNTNKLIPARKRFKKANCFFVPRRDKYRANNEKQIYEYIGSFDQADIKYQPSDDTKSKTSKVYVPSDVCGGLDEGDTYCGNHFCPEIMRYEDFLRLCREISTYNNSLGYEGFPQSPSDGDIAYSLTYVGMSNAECSITGDEGDDQPQCEGFTGYIEDHDELVDAVKTEYSDTERGFAAIQHRATSLTKSLKDGNTMHFGFSHGNEMPATKMEIGLEYSRITDFQESEIILHDNIESDLYAPETNVRYDLIDGRQETTLFPEVIADVVFPQGGDSLRIRLERHNVFSGSKEPQSYGTGQIPYFVGTAGSSTNARFDIIDETPGGALRTLHAGFAYMEASRREFYRHLGYNFISVSDSTYPDPYIDPGEYYIGFSGRLNYHQYYTYLGLSPVEMKNQFTAPKIQGQIDSFGFSSLPEPVREVIEGGYDLTDPYVAIYFNDSSEQLGYSLLESLPTGSTISPNGIINYPPEEFVNPDDDTGEEPPSLNARVTSIDATGKVTVNYEFASCLSPDEEVCELVEQRCTFPPPNADGTFGLSQTITNLSSDPDNYWFHWLTWDGADSLAPQIYKTSYTYFDPSEGGEQDPVDTQQACRDQFGDDYDFFVLGERIAEEDGPDRPPGEPSSEGYEQFFYCQRRQGPGFAGGGEVDILFETGSPEEELSAIYSCTSKDDDVFLTDRHGLARITPPTTKECYVTPRVGSNVFSDSFEEYAPCDFCDNKGMDISYFKEQVPSYSAKISYNEYLPEEEFTSILEYYENPLEESFSDSVVSPCPQLGSQADPAYSGLNALEDPRNFNIKHEFKIKTTFTRDSGVFFMLPTGKEATFVEGDKIKPFKGLNVKPREVFYETVTKDLEEELVLTRDEVSINQVRQSDQYSDGKDFSNNSPSNKAERLSMVLDEDGYYVSPVTQEVDSYQLLEQVETDEDDEIEFTEVEIVKELVPGFSLGSPDPSKGQVGLWKTSRSPNPHVYGSASINPREEWETESNIYDRPIETEKFLHGLLDMLDYRNGLSVVDMEYEGDDFQWDTLNLTPNAPWVPSEIKGDHAYSRELGINVSTQDTVSSDDTGNHVRGYDKEQVHPILSGHLPNADSHQYEETTEYEDKDTDFERIGDKYHDFPTNSLTDIEKLRHLMESHIDFEATIVLDLDELDEFGMRFDTDKFDELLQTCYTSEPIEFEIDRGKSVTSSDIESVSGGNFYTVFGAEVKRRPVNIRSNITFTDMSVTYEDVVADIRPNSTTYKLGTEGNKYGYHNVVRLFQDGEDPMTNSSAYRQSKLTQAQYEAYVTYDDEAAQEHTEARQSSGSNNLVSINYTDTYLYEYRNVFGIVENPLIKKNFSLYKRKDEVSNLIVNPVEDEDNDTGYTIEYDNTKDLMFIPTWRSREYDEVTETNYPQHMSLSVVDITGSDTGEGQIYLELERGGTTLVDQSRIGNTFAKVQTVPDTGDFFTTTDKEIFQKDGDPGSVKFGIKYDSRQIPFESSDSEETEEASYKIQIQETKGAVVYWAKSAIQVNFKRSRNPNMDNNAPEQVSVTYTKVINDNTSVSIPGEEVSQEERNAFSSGSSLLYNAFDVPRNSNSFQQSTSSLGGFSSIGDESEPQVFDVVPEYPLVNLDNVSVEVDTDGYGVVQFSMIRTPNSNYKSDSYANVTNNSPFDPELGFDTPGISGFYTPVLSGGQTFTDDENEFEFEFEFDTSEFTFTMDMSGGNAPEATATVTETQVFTLGIDLVKSSHMDKYASELEFSIYKTRILDGLTVDSEFVYVDYTYTVNGNASQYNSNFSDPPPAGFPETEGDKTEISPT